MNDYDNVACCYGRSSNLDKAFETLKPAVEGVYDHVYNFLHALTLVADRDDPIGILEKEYFGKATPGLKQFVTKYGLTAEAIATDINKRAEK